MPKKSLSLLAQKRLDFFLTAAQKSVGLRKMGPKRRPWESAVRLVDAREMKRLNESFRGKAYATDVLSFPIPAHFFELKGWVHLGELVICEPVLKAQAKDYQRASTLTAKIAQELDVLIVHGLLHLLGFDHERGEKEALVMQSWESKLITKTIKNTKTQGLIERSQSGKHT